MREPDEHELVADMIKDIALDVLAKLAGNPNSIFKFFKQFVELAVATVRATRH